MTFKSPAGVVTSQFDSERLLPSNRQRNAAKGLKVRFFALCFFRWATLDAIFSSVVRLQLHKQTKNEVRQLCRCYYQTSKQPANA